MCLGISLINHRLIWACPLRGFRFEFVKNVLRLQVFLHKKMMQVASFNLSQKWIFSTGLTRWCRELSTNSSNRLVDWKRFEKELPVGHAKSMSKRRGFHWWTTCLSNKKSIFLKSASMPNRHFADILHCQLWEDIHSVYYTSGFIWKYSGETVRRRRLW